MAALEKVFVWALNVPDGDPYKTLVFSATGVDREEAETKIVAYLKAVPVTAEAAITTEKLIRWVQNVDPLTPEVKDGVWILGVTPSIVS